MALPISQLRPAQPSFPASPLAEAEKENLSRQMREIDLKVSEFRQYLISRNMAANTIQAYSYALRQFLCRYQHADFSSLHLYKVFLLDHYKPQTVNLRLRALNAYLEFTREKSKKLSLVRIQQKSYLENVISEADYEYFKSCLLRDKRYLYYFLVRFMAATGARVSEVVLFQAEDIQKGFKEIYSKGNKTRRIYIPKALRTDALLWLQSAGIHRGDIFLNRFGRRITPAGIRSQLKTLAVSYGINPDVVHPHSFRHRFAKSFIEKCGDISLLSDLLGHKTIETTRIYLRRSSNEQYEIVNKVVDW